MPRGLWDYGNDAIKAMIPIHLQAQRLEAEKAMAQDRLTQIRALKEEEYQKQSEKLMLDAENAKTKIKLDTLMKGFEQAQKDGDGETAKAFAAEIEKHMPELSLPQIGAGKGKPPTSMDALLAQRMASEGASLEDIIKTKERIGRASSSSVNVNNIPPGNVGLGKPQQGKVQESIMEKDDALAVIDRVLFDFDPAFLNVEKRIGASWDSLKSKSSTMQGIFGKVKPEDQQFLQNMGAWMADSYTLMNTHIKNRTGATMGVQEASRLMKEMPNPGDGTLPGDDPQTFLSKAKKVRKTLALDRARALTYLKQGIGDTGPLTKEQLAEKAKSNSLVSLEKFQANIDQRGDEIESDVRSKNPGMSASDIAKAVEAQLRSEFNLE